MSKLTKELETALEAFVMLVGGLLVLGAIMWICIKLQVLLVLGLIPAWIIIFYQLKRSKE